VIGVPRPSAPMIEDDRPNLTAKEVDAGTREVFQQLRFLVMVATNGCNIRCTYCNASASGAGGPHMPPELAVDVAEVLVKCTRWAEVHLHFHGGEPLLLSRAWFESVVSRMRERAALCGKRLSLSVQTNGTLVDAEWTALFKRLRLDVGVSCDGPPAINDLRRQQGEAAERGLRLLLAAGIRAGINAVLHQDNCRHMGELMDYAHRLGCRGMQVNFLETQGRGVAGEPIAARDLFTGMRQVFDQMRRTRCSVVDQTMQRLLARYMLGRLRGQRNCWEMECGAGSWFAAVDWTGRISPCDTHMERWELGNIRTRIEPQHVRETLRAFHRKGPWYIRCFSCEARRICSFGCTMNAHNSPAARDNQCEFTKLLFGYFNENQQAVAAVHARLLELAPQGVWFR